MAVENSDTLGKERARRRRERILILATLLAVALITYLETQVVHLSGDLPMASSILVFALININALLLLMIIFLVFRNLVKLIVERRKGLLGSQLRTKLVVAFVLLSLVPTGLLFFATFQFVDTSIEYWFSVEVDRSLFQALELSESYNQQVAANTAHFAQAAAQDLRRRRFDLARPSKALANFVEAQRRRYDLAALRLFSPDLKELASATQSGTHLSHLQGLPLDVVSRALSQGKPQRHLQAAPTGDFAAAVHPVMLPGPKGKQRPVAAAVAYRLLPKGALSKMAVINKGLLGYRELKSLKQPIKTNQYITLSIVALLIILAATWFGFHLAKNITVPLIEVAHGTQRIAEGDYNVFIDRESSDEIGTLVNAFNRMSADLATSKARLEKAQKEMRRSTLELERRRRYMEIVLQNVAAGVIAVDAEGIITTFNPSAESILKVQAAGVLGRPWRDLLRPQDFSQAQALMAAVSQSGGMIDRQVRLSAGGEPLNLMVHVAGMRDELGRNLGAVAVFEDLTELVKAQRMAAWRQVARRIAHEVKNPLTPIKLSAQRLTRRYRERLADDARIFDECTKTIVEQVDALRALVNEFSTFARLPTVRLAPADLLQIASDTLTMYRSAHPEVSFALEQESPPPIFELDREALKRVLINLLDNAVAAVQESPPPWQVVLRLSYDPILKIVRLEVEDSGMGVSADDKLHLFEPYFTTKHGGTGLGLAIVSTLVSDHKGYVRVQDNEPRGTRIIVELPVRGAGGEAQEAV